MADWKTGDVDMLFAFQSRIKPEMIVTKGNIVGRCGLFLTVLGNRLVENRSL